MAEFFAKNKKLIFEFLRYAVVGGISAVIDMGVNFAMLFYVLGGTKDDKGLVALSVAAGFAVGLLVNFILSNVFVFKEKEQREKGKTLSAFLFYYAPITIPHRSKHLCRVNFLFIMRLRQ